MQVGTFSWAAPEVLLGKPCTEKVDIYSYGVLLWELSAGEAPPGRNLRPLRWAPGHLAGSAGLQPIGFLLLRPGKVIPFCVGQALALYSAIEMRGVKDV